MRSFCGADKRPIRIEVKAKINGKIKTYEHEN
jgi:hypothetical protein